MNNACVLQVHVAEDRGQDLMYSRISEDGSKLLYIGTIRVGIKIRHIFYVIFLTFRVLILLFVFNFEGLFNKQGVYTYTAGTRIY